MVRQGTNRISEIVARAKTRNKYEGKTRNSRHDQMIKRLVMSGGGENHSV